MPVRGEDAATRIEARIRAALERIVIEMRTSIDDVRTAVDQQLSAAVQSVQADFNSFEVRSHLEEGLREFEESPNPPEYAPASGSTELKAALRSIEAGKNQIDILNALLEQCLPYASRAALLIIRGDSIAGWRGVGFEEGDDPFKKFTTVRSDIPQLDQLIREESLVIWDGRNLSGRAGITPNANAAAIPMVIKDKVAAAVYVDVTEADRGKLDLSALQILVFTTGLLIDTLPIRKNVPSPSLRGDLVGDRGSSAPDPDSEHRASEETVAIPAFRMGSAAEQRLKGADPARPAGFSTVATPIDRVEPPPPSPPVTEESIHPAGSAASESERPSTQYIPPPGLSRRSNFSYSGEDETRRHDEAKRFARLLVSEIKLYNESQVEQGRRGKDIYDRLKQDIDRSRQIYDERVPDDVRKSSNYYYDELIRILADGDPDALGL